MPDLPSNTISDTVVFLMGPTAVGKSALAMALAERLPVEIVSVDSGQVYRGMDIGSAKPGPDERRRVPHHLIDIRDPAEPYSAADFRNDAEQCVASILHRGHLPLLVGGSMLYFRVLLEGLGAALPRGDSAVRQQIREAARREGWPSLHRRLAVLDPETAAALHPNHSQRIVRALEVFELSGRPMSALQRESSGESGFGERYRLRQLALLPDSRPWLHKRIETRFHDMLQAGFEEEVGALVRRGDLSAELPAIRAVGYRQLWEYCAGHYSHREMIERGIIATRQLAKRQLTWLRRWPALEKIEVGPDSGTRLQEICDKALNYIRSRAI